MGHVDVLLGLAAAVGAALGLGLGDGVDLLEARVLAGGLLADGGELANDVVEAGKLDAVEHVLELQVNGVPKARFISPDELGVVVLAGAHHQDPPLGLELIDRPEAVRPPVLQILDGKPRGVGLRLQVRQQRHLRLNTGDLWSELVSTLLPARLLLLLGVLVLLGTGLGTRGWEELHLRVFTHEHGKLLLLLLGGVLEGEVIEDVLQGLGSAFGLEEFDGVCQVGQHVIAVVGIGGGHGSRSRSGGDAAVLQCGGSGTGLALMPLGRGAIGSGGVGCVRRRGRGRRETLLAA